MREGCTECARLNALRAFLLFHHMLHRPATARWHAVDKEWREHLATHEGEATP